MGKKEKEEILGVYLTEGKVVFCCCLGNLRKRTRAWGIGFDS